MEKPSCRKSKSILVQMEQCAGNQSLGSWALLFPQTAYLELTPACNNNCPSCVNREFIADSGTRELRPSFDHCSLDGSGWDRILDKLVPCVSLINLTGGEPTLHPDFEAIAASIDHRGIDFGVLTNGRWREPGRLIAFLSQLPCFQGFLVSLHGASAGTHDAFSRTPGSFEETVANIALAARAGFTVSTSTIINRYNLAELNLIAALSHDLGAKGAAFNRYLIPAARRGSSAGGSSLTDLVPTRGELRAAVRTIERLRREVGEAYQISYGPCIPQCFVASSSAGCSAGGVFFVVDPWGNVKPCTDTTLHCGNLMAQTVEEVWWSQEMQYWRELVPTECSDCAAFATCRAGCRAMALASGLERDPLMQGPIHMRENTLAQSLGETQNYARH